MNARALLELLRVSNLPTCVTNVLVGCAAAAVGPFPVLTALGVSGAIALMYVSGMALNDALDAEVDRRERPDRPIPSGRVTRFAAFSVAAAAMAAGLAVLLLGFPATTPWALLLAGAIVIYDVVHRRAAASVALLGACRGLVYLVAAAAVAGDIAQPAVLAPAAAMAGYVVALSIVARNEAAAPRPRGAPMAAVLAAVALWPALLLPPPSWIGPMTAAVLLVAWLLLSGARLRRDRRVPRAVMAWLAGICLVDAWFLALLDRPGAAAAAAAAFVVTVAAHRTVPGS